MRRSARREVGRLRTAKHAEVFALMPRVVTPAGALPCGSSQLSWAGHEKLETTARYLHVATGTISAVESPLDRLSQPKRKRPGKPQSSREEANAAGVSARSSVPSEAGGRGAGCISRHLLRSRRAFGTALVGPKICNSGPTEIWLAAPGLMIRLAGVFFGACLGSVHCNRAE